MVSNWTSLMDLGFRIIRGLRESVHALFDFQEASSQLVRDTAGTLIIRVAALASSFLIGVILARLLGATGYGIYAHAMAWVGLLSAPALLGIDKLIVRELSIHFSRSEWGLVHGLLRWASQKVILASIGLALIAFMVIRVMAERYDAEMLSAVLIALMLLPLLALGGLIQASMRGLHRIIAGQIPLSIIQPGLFISLIVILTLILGDEPASNTTLVLNILATGLAVTFGWALLRKYVPQAVKEASSIYRNRLWLRSAMPFLYVSIMQMMNPRIATILLGAIIGAEDVGVYSVANRGAELIMFPLVAVNLVIAPTLARMYADGDIKYLQGLITRSACAAFLLSLPIALVLTLLGNSVLLIFGNDFTRGKTALLILSLGQLINIASGSVALLLNMAGYEKSVALAMGISTAINVILNSLLIPRWGLEGAAVAVASSLAFWNLFLVIYAQRNLAVHTSVLGIIRIHRK